MLVCFGERSQLTHLPSQSAPSTLVFKKLGLFEDLKTTDYRLDERKGSFFWGKGHVQGPQIW